VTDRTAFAGGTLLTLDAESSVRRADLLVEDGCIVDIGGPYPDAEQIDCENTLVLPGFVQAHVHLCQALFRGLAEETDLLTWLERKIWPLEAAHTPESLAVSTRLGLIEMLMSGTTTLCDMGSVPHADALAEVVEESGVRAVVSKLLMDMQEGAPPGLLEDPEHGMRDAEKLFDRFDGAGNGRLRFAVAPRFVLSCSKDLFQRVARFSQERNALVHTHINESRREVESTEKLLGQPTVSYFDALGLLNERLVAAHGLWFTEAERALLGERRAHIVHCPGANLKLASGVCDVRALRDAGVVVALGADGLPCNNRADNFAEMRLAGLLSRNLSSEESLSAEEVVRMATIEGARALGLDHQVGSLETGKRADLVVLDTAGSSGALLAHTDPYEAIVYQYSAEQVRTVAVDGKLLVEAGRVLGFDEEAVVRSAETERRELLKRAGGPWPQPH
jgi:cytosine/adenosine deaminase-related metal-dependent hydrolase